MNIKVINDHHIEPYQELLGNVLKQEFRKKEKTKKIHDEWLNNVGRRHVDWLECWNWCYCCCYYYH